MLCLSCHFVRRAGLRAGLIILMTNASRTYSVTTRLHNIIYRGIANPDTPGLVTATHRYIAVITGSLITPHLRRTVGQKALAHDHLRASASLLLFLAPAHLTKHLH